MPSLSRRPRLPGDFKFSALLLVGCGAGFAATTADGGGFPGAFTTSRNDFFPPHLETFAPSFCTSAAALDEEDESTPSPSDAVDASFGPACTLSECLPSVEPSAETPAPDDEDNTSPPSSPETNTAVLLALEDDLLSSDAMFAAVGVFFEVFPLLPLLDSPIHPLLCCCCGCCCCCCCNTSGFSHPRVGRGAVAELPDEAETETPSFPCPSPPPPFTITSLLLLAPGPTTIPEATTPSTALSCAALLLLTPALPLDAEADASLELPPPPPPLLLSFVLPSPFRSLEDPPDFDFDVAEGLVEEDCCCCGGGCCCVCGAGFLSRAAAYAPIGSGVTIAACAAGGAAVAPEFLLLPPRLPLLDFSSAPPALSSPPPPPTGPDPEERSPLSLRPRSPFFLSPPPPPPPL